MAHSKATQDALLKWVNSFPVDTEVESIEDLNDGVALAKVMGDIDPSYEADNGDDLLKGVVDSLTSYIRQHCKEVVLLLGTPGLNAFTKGSGDIVELISLFLMAAIEGPVRNKYIADITTKFDSTIQAGLQQIIEQNFTKIKMNKESVESNANVPQDHDLEFEQRYGAILQSKAGLEGENARLNRVIQTHEAAKDRSQVNYNKLKDDFMAIEAQLNALASKGDLSSLVDSLRADVQDREDHIANQEAALEESRVLREKAVSEIGSMKANSDELVLVKNELRLMRTENAKLSKLNEDLQKKANTAENFRKKLESIRDFEGECQELGRMNEELLTQCKDAEQLRHLDKVQKRRLGDFENALSQHETEIYELTMQKSVLAEQNHELENKVQTLEFQINQFEETQGNHYDNLSPQPNRDFNSLEAELASPLQTESDSVVIAALRAQIEVLKRDSSPKEDDNDLRNQVEESERLNKLLNVKYKEYFEKFAIAEQRVRAVLDNSVAEGTQAFSNLHKAHQDASEALAKLESQHREAKAELGQSKRDLFEATNDLSAISQEEVDALRTVKDTQEALQFSLKSELKDLQDRHKNLVLEYELQKSQLVETILAKDELQRAKDQGADDGINLVKHNIELAQQQKLMDELKKSHNEQLRVHQDTISSLEDKLQSIGESSPDQKESLERQNFNLKREYDMMAGAWYDLTRRLQSNNVLLHRRSGEPKSWLKQQRQAVNPPPRR